MPRISQVAMVLVTLGLCIGINSWRYPIVRQMVAQLPNWEFSIQPRQARGQASASAPIHPPTGSNETTITNGGLPAPPLSSLSVGIPPRPEGNPTLAPTRCEEGPTGGVLSSLPTQSGGAFATKSEAEHPSNQLNPNSQDPGPQGNGYLSGNTPDGLADITQNGNQHKREVETITPSARPLVPLDTYDKGSNSAERTQNSPSGDSRAVCTGWGCQVRPTSPEIVHRTETADPDSTRIVPPARVRIIQVRALPSHGENFLNNPPERVSSHHAHESLEGPSYGENSNNPAESLAHTNNLLRSPSEQGKPRQNGDCFPSEEDKIELLPPVDPPIGGGSQRLGIPWPAGTMPFYPSTHPN